MTTEERTTLENLLDECEMAGLAVSAVLEDDATPDDLAQVLQDLGDAVTRARTVIGDNADA